MFKFKVYLADGEQLDDYVAAVPNWQPGDALYVDGRPKYCITRIVPSDTLEEPEYTGVWQVELI